MTYLLELFNLDLDIILREEHTESDVSLLLNKTTLELHYSEEVRTEQLEILVHNVMKGDPGPNDFEQLLNRPKYDGSSMTGNTDIPAVPTRTSELDNDSGFIGDAPSDNNIYGRRNRQWQETAYKEDVEWGDF